MAILFASPAYAYPGQSRKLLAAQLKRHPLFPSSNFFQTPGEVGPYTTWRLLTGERKLFFDAYYDTNFDDAKSIRYEQISIFNDVLEKDCHEQFQTDDPFLFQELGAEQHFWNDFKHCIEGVEINLSKQETKTQEVLQLIYGKPSAIAQDFMSAKLSRQGRQYFYKIYSEERLQRKMLPEPILFQLFVGNSFCFLVSNNTMIVTEKKYSFERTFAEWEIESTLFKKLKSDMQKQQPFNL